MDNLTCYDPVQTETNALSPFDSSSSDIYTGFGYEIFDPETSRIFNALPPVSPSTFPTQALPLRSTADDQFEAELELLLDMAQSDALLKELLCHE